MDERMVEIAAMGIWEKREDFALAQNPGAQRWSFPHDPTTLEEARAGLQALLDAGYQIIPPVEGKVT